MSCEAGRADRFSSPVIESGARSAVRDAAQASMSHLDIEDGVLIGLLLCLVHIEDQVRLAPAHQEVVAHRIPTDLLDQIPHREIGAGALGDLQLFTAFHHRDHLMEYILGIIARGPDLERLQSRSHSSHSAVMIRSLHVDRLLKAALPFGDVVSNVRNKVGIGSVRLPHDPILVVTVRRGPEIDRAVIREGEPPGFERPRHRIHLSVLVERGLEEIHIEADSERPEIEILFTPESRTAIRRTSSSRSANGSSGFSRR